ncbi:hypothetical protein AW736_12595 [Termitidicoccus mucosus]|uniref:Uncharacterized protein n=1 Tax=Termitidicoccus mucosus TaxID=1184151 RepID=A0A178IK84_9BACT|nr:hypothetical protein AW736_12595 [Opitutaceae bacterium TSB47]
MPDSGIRSSFIKGMASIRNDEDEDASRVQYSNGMHDSTNRIAKMFDNMRRNYKIQAAVANTSECLRINKIRCHDVSS